MDFGTRYKQLNAAQNGVDTIDGPIMVIAGQARARPNWLAMRAA